MSSVDIDTDTLDFDPFNAPVDSDESQETLIRSLKMARGFVLLFAVINSAPERNRRMEAVEAELSGKTIQRIAVNTETENLLWHIRDTITDPKPDAVFVYGLENWISGAINPRTIPFLVNLNAARDSFPTVVERPVVFWVPQYVLSAISEAAPDFFSVRSGVYRFPISPEERDETTRVLLRVKDIEANGYSLLERITRIQELQGLLTEYRNLPENQRDPQRETSILNAIALQLDNEGRYREAEILFNEALNIDRKTLPADHPRLAIHLSNFATLYINEGRYEEAESLFNEALSIDRKTLSDNHPDLAIRLNNIANLYTQQGRFAEAEPFYNEALGIVRKSLPENHPTLAIYFSNLANLYINQGRYGEAESLLDEALSIDRKTLPDNHPSLASHLNNLGSLYSNQGRFDESEQLYKEALAKGRASLPGNHPSLAIRLNNLGTLYSLLGRYEEAKQLYDEALEIDRNSLSENHPSLAIDLCNLANLYKSQGNYDKAEQYYGEAVAIDRKSLSKNHPSLRLHLSNLAHLYKKMGRDDEVKALEEELAGMT